MFRFLIAGVVAMTLFLVGATLGLVTQGDPPAPHVRLPDRGSPITTAAPGNGLDGIQTAIIPAITYASQVETNRAQAEEAERQRQEAEAVASRVPARTPSAAVSATSVTGACASGGGYDAVPRYIIDRESGGDYCVKNPSSSACGKYQILDTTWNGYGGYASACDAPPSVQDEKAASMNPCHWSPPSYCAG